MIIMNYALFQRKFARESQEPKNDTFKKFREWLDQTFVTGIPSEEEWQRIMEDDDAYNYAQPVYQERHDSHTSGAGGSDYFEEDGEGVDGQVTPYNPEMHAF